MPEYTYEPMNPNFRPKNCVHVSCGQPATQVRWRFDGDNNKDKSSKTFVCDQHLETKQL